MANLTAVISADTSKFVGEVKSARQMLNKFVQDTKEASTSIKENSSATNEQVQAYSRVISQLEKVASGALNTKQQQQALADQIKELKIQWQSLSDAAKSSDFGKSLSDTLKNATNELDNLKNKLASVDDIKPSGNLKKQLRETQTELINLTGKYRAMSAAEKSSANGRELAAKLDELREKAGGLTDTIGDVQQEIKVMASDTPNLDVFNDALGIGADLLSTYSSVIAKVTGDEESLKNAIATVMTVQSAANLITKVTNALQSSSAIMLKVRAIQEGAAALAIRIKTAAENKSTAATIAATAAQRVFNAVAKANPYVLLATAILGVGAALIGFTSLLGQSSEAEVRAQREAEELKAKQEHLREQTEELNETSSKTKVKFFELQAQWKNLKTEAEQRKWITDNQSAFNEIGISVNSVKTAEDVFINNTDAVCDALLQRAIAAKRAEQAANDLIDLEKEYDTPSLKNGGIAPKYKKGDKISDEVAKKIGIRTTKERTYSVSLGGYGSTTSVEDYSKAEIEKINAYYSNNAKSLSKFKQDTKAGQEKKIKDRYIQAIKDESEANKKLLALGDAPKASRGGGGNTSTAPTYAEGSLSDLEERLSKLQKQYKDGLRIDLSVDEYKSKIKELEDAIKAKKIELGLEPIIPEGSIAKIDEELNKKNNELKLAVDDASRKKIQDEIDKLTGKKQAIQLYLKPAVTESDIEDINKSINEHLEGGNKTDLPLFASKAEKAQSAADALKDELDFQKSLVSSLGDEYKLVQQRIQAGAVLTDNENKLVSIYDEAIGKVKELTDEYKQASKSAKQLQDSAELKKKTWEGIKTGISTVGDLNGSVANVGSTWKSLTEQWDDMSTFEQVTSAIDATISTIESAIQAFEGISAVIKLFQQISSLASKQKIADNQAETQSTIAKLGADEAGAIAGATKSGASLPFPANIAAIAAGIAAVVAGFAMVFSCFADGGIVGGGSKIGDYNIARVNSGEMILNGTQQKRLFNLLDGTGSRNGTVVGEGGSVQFKIKGQNLYGVLRNHSQKSNKIGR